MPGRQLPPRGPGSGAQGQIACPSIGGDIQCTPGQIPAPRDFRGVRKTKEPEKDLRSQDLPPPSSDATDASWAVPCGASGRTRVRARSQRPWELLGALPVSMRSSGPFSESRL